MLNEGLAIGTEAVVCNESLARFCSYIQNHANTVIIKGYDPASCGWMLEIGVACFRLEVMRVVQIGPYFYRLKYVLSANDWVCQFYADPPFMKFSYDSPRTYHIFTRYDRRYIIKRQVDNQSAMERDFVVARLSDVPSWIWNIEANVPEVLCP